jgi:ABC-2 type transport system ATP-binding protein
VGPNGAGKSTAIEILVDYTRPTEGEVSVLGFDPGRDKVELLRRVGVVHDEYRLYEGLTGAGHIEYVADAKDVPVDSPELLARVGLDGHGEGTVGAYSNGMQQRLALAMALVGDPELLVLDEPFSNLDPNGMRRFKTVVREESERGATVMLSSHLLSQVDDVCDVVGVLVDGQLETEGTPSELRETWLPDRRFTVDLSVRPSDLERIAGTDGIEDAVLRNGRLAVNADSTVCDDDVVEAVESADGAVERVSVDDPTMEEVFASITQTESELGQG